APVPWMSKSDRSPVTAADYAVQAAVGRLLRKSQPALPIVAEETAAALRVEPAGPLREVIVKTLQDEIPGASEEAVLEWIDWGAAEPPKGEPFWTLDPVDGTRGFLADRRYVVALALIDRGEVVLGGLACPGTRPRSVDGGRANDGRSDGLLALAARGGGAWMTGLGNGEWVPMGVSDIGDAARSRVLVSAEPAHLDAGQLTRVSSLMRLVRPPTPMDSQVKYALLAAGEFDLILRLPRRVEKQKIWDFAAGVCIVEEAGGVVTDLEGNRLRFDSGVDLPNPPGVIASNGRLQAAALAAVAEARKSAA
ncbi:MAG: inositol monophosphatase family protein, partial [Anaerolineales bacterium]